MTERIYHVLFLCTGNSARSILAECILNRLGVGRFYACSAGSHPTGEINPYTMELLQRLSYSTASLRSKSWEEFASPESTPLDFVFTVCDKAAGEACPAWPGQPMSAHWGIPDPAAAQGVEAERRLAFSEAYRMLANRIGTFINLPIDSLDKLSLQEQLNAIGSRVSEELAT